LSGELSGKQYS
jgi:hypothetical protein